MTEHGFDDRSGEHEIPRGGRCDREQQPPKSEPEVVSQCVDVAAIRSAGELGHDRSHDGHCDESVGQLEEDECRLVLRQRAALVGGDPQDERQCELIGDDVADGPSREPDESVYRRVAPDGADREDVDTGAPQRRDQRHGHRCDTGRRTDPEDDDERLVCMRIAQ